mmetsp:Transcript_59707/g.174597  ORF Transcript_59707/g.174597 Transcript_59707/m.174597 type:complete len:363 (-) Transcript_59707:320-1408(-)
MRQVLARPSSSKLEHIAEVLLDSQSGKVLEREADLEPRQGHDAEPLPSTRCGGTEGAELGEHVPQLAKGRLAEGQHGTASLTSHRAASQPTHDHLESPEVGVVGKEPVRVQVPRVGLLLLLLVHVLALNGHGCHPGHACLCSCGLRALRLVALLIPVGVPSHGGHPGHVPGLSCRLGGLVVLPTLRHGRHPGVARFGLGRGGTGRRLLLLGGVRLRWHLQRAAAEQAAHEQHELAAVHGTVSRTKPSDRHIHDLALNAKGVTEGMQALHVQPVRLLDAVPALPNEVLLPLCELNLGDLVWICRLLHGIVGRGVCRRGNAIIARASDARLGQRQRSTSQHPTHQQHEVIAIHGEVFRAEVCYG